MKILLIEDDGSVQRAMSRMLRRQFGDVDVWVAPETELEMAAARG